MKKQASIYVEEFSGSDVLSDLESHRPNILISRPGVLEFSPSAVSCKEHMERIGSRPLVLFMASCNFNPSALWKKKGKCSKCSS